MLKVLIKKQLSELYRGFFFDQKKGQTRSKLGTVMFIAMYALLMIGILGGMFAYCSLSICGVMVSVGADWLYFGIMGAITLALGVFGSVFNTYSGLYMAKDNDLLLSMPIPVGVIMASRLLGVYLLGLMFSAVVAVPAVVVYLCTSGFTISKLIGGIMFTLIMSIGVLILSCLLGWVVARISTKIKNKSFVTVFASLVFIAAYYFVYFKASDYLGYITQNVLMISSAVAEKAAFVCFIGNVGVGKALNVLVCLAVVLVLLGALVYIMSKSFIRLVSSGGTAAKVKYKERKSTQRSIRSALLSKELARFTSSANYMLNCGLGILVEPVAAVMLVIKGAGLRDALMSSFGENTSFVYIIVIAGYSFILSMNDFTAPSVSLEGKSVWIAQSIPVSPWYVLRAKLDMHMVLSFVPVLPLMAVCVILFRPGIIMGLFMVIIPALMIVFFGEFGLFLGTLKPTLNYTNEVYVIKQSLPALLAIFSGFGVGIIFAGIYYLLIGKLNAELYCLLFSLVLIAASIVLWQWLKKKGSAIFAAL